MQKWEFKENFFVACARPYQRLTWYVWGFLLLLPIECLKAWWLVKPSLS